MVWRLVLVGDALELLYDDVTDIPPGLFTCVVGVSSLAV